MTTYFCKYTPIELLRAFGEELSCPNEETPDHSASDHTIHSNICSHAKQFLQFMIGRSEQAMSRPPTDSASVLCQGCRGISRTVLTNCCDSIRRVMDVLLLSGYPKEQLVLLDLPHRADPASVQNYASECRRLICNHRSLSPEDPLLFHRAVFLSEWENAVGKWKRFLQTTHPFFAILGARAGDQLLEHLGSFLKLPLMDLTCGGFRTLPPPPENAVNLPFPVLLSAYSQALLTQIPCPRMEDVSLREDMLGRMEANSALKGILYHTVRFCDYYSYEYARLSKRISVPVLKLETDYTSPDSGQLATRLEAFQENILQKEREKASMAESKKAAFLTNPRREKSDFSESGKPPFYIGIDSGSTTTNVVAVDSRGRIAAYFTTRTGAQALRAAENSLDQIRIQLRRLPGEICRVLATGYGRDYIRLAEETRTEISCHALGARFQIPSARTIIDIGGQDSKVICLDEKGNITNFIMNDKCAAGTGRFLEMMAHTLEMDLKDMALKGISWKRDLTISSVCTVFAESEVISLIARNNDIEDIIHALNKAVAVKTCSMIRRAGGQPPFLMTGGVARNLGVVKHIEAELGASLTVPPDPELNGAYGAALYAGGFA